MYFTTSTLALPLKLVPPGRNKQTKIQSNKQTRNPPTNKQINTQISKINMERTQPDDHITLPITVLVKD